MGETLVKRLMIESNGDSHQFRGDPSTSHRYKKVDEWTDGIVRFVNYKGVYSGMLGDMNVNIIELYKIEKP